MTLSAIGVSVERHRGGTITVRARIVNSDTEQSELVAVTDTTLDGCKAQLQADIQARTERARDEALHAAVVGQVLATSDGDNAD